MEKRYSKYPSKLTNIFAKFRKPNITLIVTKDSALNQEHFKNLSNCLGSKCELPIATHIMDGTFYRYMWNLQISDMPKFKERLDKFRKQYTRTAVYSLPMPSTTKTIKIILSSLGALSTILGTALLLLTYFDIKI